MALTPQNNEAFLREVDEELRRDQALDFWRKHGRTLIVAIVVALAAFAGYLFWQHQRTQAAADEGIAFQDALDSLQGGNTAAAAAPLATLATSRSAGYRALAQFTQGDLALQKSDLKGAAAKFGAIAADTSLAQPFRDLALVRQTTAEFDTLKPEVVIARLRGLAMPGNPWFGSAGELVAAAYLRQGRVDLAGPLFGKIAADDGVPATIRQRAVQMASAMEAAGGARLAANTAANKDSKAQ